MRLGKAISSKLDCFAPDFHYLCPRCEEIAFIIHIYNGVRRCLDPRARAGACVLQARLGAPPQGVARGVAHRLGRQHPGGHGARQLPGRERGRPLQHRQLVQRQPGVAPPVEALFRPAVQLALHLRRCLRPLREEAGQRDFLQHERPVQPPGVPGGHCRELPRRGQRALPLHGQRQQTAELRPGTGLHPRHRRIREPIDQAAVGRPLRQLRRTAVQRVGGIHVQQDGQLRERRPGQPRRPARRQPERPAGANPARPL